MHLDFLIIFCLKRRSINDLGTPEEVLTHSWLQQLFAIEAVLGTFPNSSKPLLLTYELGANT